MPAEVLLELAADAIELAGASRDAPIEFEEIREGPAIALLVAARRQVARNVLALD